MSWRTESSRSGDPTRPWKYFWTTMFVAVCDHDFGTSTFFCSKMTSPFSEVIAAVRNSHSTAPYGEMEASEYMREKVSPLRPFAASRAFSAETTFTSLSVVLIPETSPLCGKNASPGRPHACKNTVIQACGAVKKKH